MLEALLLLSGALLGCGLGAYVIANGICQASWREKVPQSKLASFAVTFLAVFIVLFIVLTVVKTIAFGR
jgi:hypothetical protein